MFTAQHITSNASKVHYVVRALDQTIIRIVGDLLGTSASYEAIRTRLIEASATPNSTKYRDLVQPGDLGDRRPSQLLRDMRSDVPPGISSEGVLAAKTAIKRQSRPSQFGRFARHANLACGPYHGRFQPVGP